MDKTLFVTQWLLISTVILLTACGGGSSGGSGSGGSGKSTTVIVAASSLDVPSSALASSKAPSSASTEIFSLGSSKATSSAVSMVKLTITQVGEGVVGIEKNQLLNAGQKLNVPLVPKEGFRIASVTGCPGSYTLEGFITDALAVDCELKVNFDVDIVDPIADPGLKKLIKEALGLAEADELTAKKMWSLETMNPTHLDSTTNMFELQGIEHAKNMNYFRIPNLLGSKSEHADIFDLSPLAELKNLKSLVISNIHIVDLSPVANLKKLTYLMIEGSDLEDISAIANLKNLKVINFGFNKIKDLSVLQGFDNLRGLSIGGNLFDQSELNVLKNKKIDSLTLEFSRIENLDFLRGNFELESLDINGTLVNSLDPLLETGLVKIPGSSLYASLTCLVYSNNKHLRETIKTLVAKGVTISESPTDFAQESTTNPYPVADKCPANNLEISADISASYGANGNLQINWGLAGDFAGRKLNCAVYAGIEQQQLREPLLSIDDCPLVGDKLINGFAYANEDLHFILTDGFGIYKDVLVKPVASVDTGPYIQAIDWGQSVISANPRLVQNRDALLRVHVISTVPAPVPNVDVELSLNGQSTIIPMQKPQQLPDSKHFQTLTDSYSLIVPKQWVKPGLTLSVALQGKNPRVLQPIVNEKTDLYLTIVPIEILGEVAELPSEAEIQSTLKGFWPLSDVVTRVHPVFKSKAASGQDMWSLLSELKELRALENGSSYYYGFFSDTLNFKLDFIPYGGIANMGESSALGVNSVNINGHLPTWASTMLHEIGHNFSLNHVNCGEPYPWDYGYPYPLKTIGSLGLSADFTTLYLPKPHDAGGYADIMSYCWPQHVSDYSFMRVQDYLELHPPKPFASASSSLRKQKTTGEDAGGSLYISGEINSAGVVTLRRIIPVQQSRAESEAGDYKLKVISKMGKEIEQAFNVIALDHAAELTPKFFSVKIPLVEIASLEVLYQGRSIFRQFDQATVGAVRKQSAVVNSAPKLEETGSSVCVSWDAAQYKSASLLLQQGEAASVIFIDEDGGKFCSSIDGLAAGGEWRLTMRNNLHIKEIVFAR